MCSFTRGCDGNIEIVSTLINSELNKIADWLAMNKLSLNVQKTKFMIFHYRQRVITENDIPCLMINNTLIEQVTEFNFLGLTVNEYMNWNSHTQKIANKISRTLGVMNRLKQYLPISAMKLMYDSLILLHLQFGITNWGFEWDCILKLQKQALRIMTNSKYNAHTEPLFKELHLLKVKDIFDVQCLKFGINLSTKSFQIISEICLNIIMSYTKSEPEATISFTYIQPAPVVLATFWGITYRNYWINSQNIW